MPRSIDQVIIHRHKTILPMNILVKMGKSF